MAARAALGLEVVRQVTAAQLAALLNHIQTLTRRVFELSGNDDKIALMMSLQDVMAAFKVDQ